MPPDSGDGTFQSILDALPDEVAVLDARGYITFTNKTWRKFARGNNLKGRPDSLGVDYIGAIQADKEAQGVPEAMRGVLDGSRDGFHWVYPCHSPTDQHWFEMKVGPLDGGGAVVIHTEVTDRILAEDASRKLLFEHHQRKLYEQERERLQELVNGVSHDIATPLTPLLIQLEQLLNDTGLSIQTRDTLYQIKEQTKRLTDSLRRFQKHLSNATDTDLGKTRADLREWLKQQKPSWESMAHQRNVNLELEVPEATIQIDEATLTFTVGSLMDAAIRETPLNGTILFRVNQTGERYRFQITREGEPWDVPSKSILNESLSPFGSLIKVDGHTIQWSLQPATEPNPMVA